MLDVLFLGLLLLILAVSIPIWIRILRRWQNKQPLVEPRLRTTSPVGLLDVLLALMIWLVSQVIAGTHVARLTGVAVSELSSLQGEDLAFLMLASAIAQVTAVVLMALVVQLRYRGYEVFGWRSNTLFNHLYIAIAAFLVATPLALLIQMLLAFLVPYEHPVIQALIESGTAFTILAIWFSAVVGAPIAEEFFFRGLMQNWLQRPGAGTDIDDLAQTMLGGWTAAGPQQVTRDSNSQRRQTTAIVIASLLFALAHSGQGLAPIPLFGLSLLLGYLYQRTGSLLPGIALHSMFNAYSVFWLTLQILFPESAEVSGAGQTN